MGENYTLGETEPNADGTDPGAPRVYSLIPDKTMLAAEVLNVKTEIMPFKDKETGAEVRKVSFKFQITEPGEYEDRYVWGSTSTSFVDHPGCKLRSWVSELVAADSLPAGFSFNTDDLLDAECRVIIGVRSWIDKDNVTQERNQVTDVLRAKSLSDSVYDNEEPF